jgi:hypothetical protein
MELIEEFLGDSEQTDFLAHFDIKKEPNSVTFTLKKEFYYSIEIKKIGNGYKVYPLYEDHNNCLIMTKEDLFDSVNHYLYMTMGLHMAKKLQRKLEDTTRFSCYFTVEDIHPYSVFISKKKTNQHFSIGTDTDGNKYITDSREKYENIEELIDALIV